MVYLNFFHQRPFSTIKQKLFKPVKHRPVAPQKCPLSNPWNLGIYFLTRQKELADIKGMDLEMEDYFGISTWVEWSL